MKAPHQTLATEFNVKPGDFARVIQERAEREERKRRDAQQEGPTRNIFMDQNSKLEDAERRFYAATKSLKSDILGV